MRLKDLRNKMNEADEAAAGDDAVEGEEEKEVVKPNKPQDDVQKVKDASDGIGAEAYEMSNKIASVLETDLPKYYNVSEVAASNNTITITADIKKMKDGLITSKMTGEVIPSEQLLSTIQMMVVADVGEEIDNFEMNGPTPVAPGVFIITVVPISESNADKSAKKG